MRNQYSKALIWSLGFFVVLLLCAGGYYGLASLDRIVPPPPATATTLAFVSPTPYYPALSTPVAPVTQAISGFTLSVQPLYADSNMVLVRYSVAGPPQADAYVVEALTNGDPNLGGPHLYLTGGQELPRFIEGYSVDFGSYGYAPLGGPLQGGSVLKFDASGIQGSPASLHLDMEGHTRYGLVQVPPPYALATTSPGVVPTFPPTFTPAPSVHLPFAVDFTLPFDNRVRTAQINQSVDKDGVKLTLQRAVVTASQLRFYVQAESKGNSPGILFGTFHPGKGSGDISIVMNDDGCQYKSDGSPADCLLFYSNSNLLDSPADGWSLAITDLGNGGPHVPDVKGLWAFPFTLPPLTPTSTP